MFLVGDVGGTKTNLAVVCSESGAREPVVEARFISAHFQNLEALVRKFLKRVPYEISGASFAVAGPVVAGKATTTNLPWHMEENSLQRALGLPVVHLLNDLEAVAYGIASLPPSDLCCLNRGRAVPRGTVAVIAPGTGLGEAYLSWDGTRCRAYASEGGHSDFAPTNNVQLGLLSSMLKEHEHVSYEHVCSGRGIPNIYAYLKASAYAKEPPWLTQELAACSDPTPLIVNAALGDVPCELCRATLDMFVSILGAETGNLALKLVATGGVYMGGGIPPRILSALQSGRFMRAFQHKGRLSALLSEVPVSVILNPKAALLGAGAHALLDKR